MPIPFRPIVQVSVMDEEERQAAMVSQFTQGVVHQVICLGRDEGSLVEISNSFYAHRTHTSVFEQNITIVNPSSRSVLVQFDQLGWNSDPPFKSESRK